MASKVDQLLSMLTSTHSKQLLEVEVDLAEICVPPSMFHYVYNILESKFLLGHCQKDTNKPLMSGSRKNERGGEAPYEGGRATQGGAVGGEIFCFLQFAHNLIFEIS